MHASVQSATPVGINAQKIAVEVDVSFGMVVFYIVGLPDAAIKESAKRISTALKNSGARLPAKRITVNLAPADIRKIGTLLDLPIALGILIATDHVPKDSVFLAETIFIGELSLDGSVRPVKGALSIAYGAREMGMKRIVVPAENGAEAALIHELEVIPVSHITELVAFLRKEIILSPLPPSQVSSTLCPSSSLDFAQVKGQPFAKRALQVAAAGHHNVLFVGPPGSGKTMLAERLSSIMPPLLFDEMIETSKIYSVVGKLEGQQLITERPFRAPHHTISQAGLIGGGSYPQPGEVSFAHHGVLFLDEAAEFRRDVLEAMRQPLESGSVAISRVQQSLEFPASFLFVAALNPCPCGYFGDKKRTCSCSRLDITRYLQKLSGPLLDRIDLQVNVHAVDYETAIEGKQANDASSQQMREAVLNARAVQQKRTIQGNRPNGRLASHEIEQVCTLTPPAQELIKKAFNSLQLSMRGYHKLLSVARTIADLAQSETIDVLHVQEATMYRMLDKHLEIK